MINEFMLKLEIVTPEKKVVDAEVDSVTVPTANGEIGILQNHAPLISTLKAGILSYTTGGKTEKLVISGGFVEVGVNAVSVLADVAETSSDINVEAARAEQTQVEQALAKWGGTEEEFEAEVEKLERAQARQKLATGK